MGIDKVGIDKVGIDKVGIDKVGITPAGQTVNLARCMVEVTSDKTLALTILIMSIQLVIWL